MLAMPVMFMQSRENTPATTKTHGLHVGMHVEMGNEITSIAKVVTSIAKVVTSIAKVGLSLVNKPKCSVLDDEH